ncbi:hypothetical protein SEA_PARTRIDGE_34 [Rhodococcus phage Partridge]|uniref:Uncharacterized protein n=1 Tax=Rhodococcus phage Partridge TaxID=1897441 RepID=A0A1I9S7V0_9CAUD|nr:hypothetical protein SEA_PARTRIDGE_34 [Rhodococcus phage Partridge]
MGLKKKLAESFETVSARGIDLMVVRDTDTIGLPATYRVETVLGVILARDMTFYDALFFVEAHELAGKAHRKVNG